MDASYYANKKATAKGIVEALFDQHLAGRPEHMLDARARAINAIGEKWEPEDRVDFAELVEGTTDRLGLDDTPTEANSDRLGILLGAWVSAVSEEEAA